MYKWKFRLEVSFDFQVREFGEVKGRTYHVSFYHVTRDLIPLLIELQALWDIRSG